MDSKYLYMIAASWGIALIIYGIGVYGEHKSNERIRKSFEKARDNIQERLKDKNLPKEDRNFLEYQEKVAEHELKNLK